MSSRQDKHIAVLYGGWSGERDVSLESGRQIAKAAHELGYKVSTIDVTRDLSQLIQGLTPRPDVVINILHGHWGEDGRIQSVLDILDIPYTFSGVLSSAIAMNKNFSKKVFRMAGIPTPEYKVVPFEDAFAKAQMDIPHVIKPIAEGSSLGVYIVTDPLHLPAKPENWTYGPMVMVEEYIPGIEISAAVLGNKAIGVLELEPVQGFYDYDAKYVDGKTNHYMPARMPEEDYQKTLDWALKAHTVLECKGISRVDLRYNPKTREMYVLEVNTQPGMTPLSIVPEIAMHYGMTFHNLIDWMVENAIHEA